mgnify:CR=1 FL=1|jgi:hypothetical protein
MPDNDWKHRSNYDPETGKKFPRGEMREVPAQKKKPPKKPTLRERIRDHEGILVSDRKSRTNFVRMVGEMNKQKVNDDGVRVPSVNEAIEKKYKHGGLVRCNPSTVNR